MSNNKINKRQIHSCQKSRESILSYLSLLGQLWARKWEAFFYIMERTGLTPQVDWLTQLDAQVIWPGIHMLSLTLPTGKRKHGKRNGAVLWAQWGIAPRNLQGQASLHIARWQKPSLRPAVFSFLRTNVVIQCLSILSTTFTIIYIVGQLSECEAHGERPYLVSNPESPAWGLNACLLNKYFNKCFPSYFALCRTNGLQLLLPVLVHLRCFWLSIR